MFEKEILQKRKSREMAREKWENGSSGGGIPKTKTYNSGYEHMTHTLVITMCHFVLIAVKTCVF